MRRLNALLVSFALAVVLAACGRGGESDLPALGDAQVHDSGKHVLGDSPTVLSHTFALRNTSPHVLKVVKTSASCGCTSVKPRTETVGIDEVFELDVVVRVTSAGTRTETASVVFDDVRDLRWLGARRDPRACTGPLGARSAESRPSLLRPEAIVVNHCTPPEAQAPLPAGGTGYRPDVQG